MSDGSTINSDTYWDGRFSSDWEECEGPKQSRFFARLAIENLPSWLIEQIRRHSLTLVDWGCAQGDGTDVWASHVDSRQLVGVDFSAVAVEQAASRYPEIRFVMEDWLGDSVGESESFDVVFSSNTLEHFHRPYEVLEALSSRAKKAVVLALPYRELDRIDEHFYSFLPSNVPIELSNGFRLVWSRVIDCTQSPDALWDGDQVFLVYAEKLWIETLKLTLDDCQVGIEDTASTIASLNREITTRGGWIDSLNKEVTARDGWIDSLNKEVTARDGWIDNLNQEVAVRDSRIDGLNQEVSALDGHIASFSQQLTGEIQELTGEIQELTGEIADAEFYKKDKENYIAQLRLDVQERDLKVMVLEGQIAEAEFCIRDKENYIAQLRLDVQERDQKLEAILDAISWRITRPLRIANRLWYQYVARYFRVGTDDVLTAKSTGPTLIEQMPDQDPVIAAEPAQKAVDPAAPALNDQKPNEDQIAVAPPTKKTTGLTGSALRDPGPTQDWVEAATYAQKIAIVPCAFEFDEIVNQRPINAAKYYAQQGYLVLFIAWQWSRGEVLTRGSSQVWQSIYQVPLFDFIDYEYALPAKQLDAVYLLTLPAPILVDLVPVLRSRGYSIVYDVMDEWEDFHKCGQASWFDRDVELHLVLNSDVVCAVAPALVSKFSGIRDDIQLIGNGYTPDMLGTEFRGVAGKNDGENQTVGYFGHLTDAWFDWTLVFALADALPEIHFDLIGYGEPDWVRERVVESRNVKLIGKVHPKDLHEHVRHWNFGIIPFVEGELARAVDPIKIYEYLYFGLPTFVTGIEHLQSYPNVFFAARTDAPSVFSKFLKRTAVDSSVLDTFLEKTTWDARFDRLQSYISQKKVLGDMYVL